MKIWTRNKNIDSIIVFGYIICVIIPAQIWVKTKEWPITIICFAAGVVAVTVASIIVNIFRDRKEKISGITEVDKMNDEQFKQFVSDLFRKFDYDVSMPFDCEPNRVNMIITRKGSSAVVRTKFSKKYLGIKSIQDVIAGTMHYKMPSGICVTNCYFSNDAQKLARHARITMIDRDKLVSLMIKAKKVKEN